MQKPYGWPSPVCISGISGILFLISGIYLIDSWIFAGMFMIDSSRVPWLSENMPLTYINPIIPATATIATITPSFATCILGQATN